MGSHTTETEREKAIAFAESFTTDNPRKVWSLKDDSPQWMRDAVRNAHGEKLPDDWTYAMCSNVADTLAELFEYFALWGELEDELCTRCRDFVDIYTTELTAWVASNVNRVSYVDTAAVDYGIGPVLFHMLQAGQEAEILDIAHAIVAAVRGAE